MKEKYFVIEKNLSNDKSSLRSEKHHMNDKMQIAIEKIVQRQQREVDDLMGVMNQKQERLNAYYKERMSEKRVSRDKLSDIKEDVSKFKLSKESIWDKVTLSTSATLQNGWED